MNASSVVADAKPEIFLVIAKFHFDLIRLRVPEGRGLGGRSSPKPTKQTTLLGPGDRLTMVSDGILADEKGKAGLGFDGLIQAALRSERGAAADTGLSQRATQLLAHLGEGPVALVVIEKRPLGVGQRRLVAGDIRLDVAVDDQRALDVVELVGGVADVDRVVAAAVAVPAAW